MCKLCKGEVTFRRIQDRGKQDKEQLAVLEGAEGLAKEVAIRASAMKQVHTRKQTSSGARGEQP